MQDVTKKYIHMIEAFECDFALAKDDGKNLIDIDLQDERMLADINLLEELSFLLRNGKVMICEK